MVTELFSLELIGVTSQDYDLEVTVTGFPTVGDVYTALASQQPQWYEEPVDGDVVYMEEEYKYEDEELEDVQTIEHEEDVLYH